MVERSGYYLFLVLVSTALTASLSRLELFQKAEFHTRDLRVARQAGVTEPSKDICLVTIDEGTGEALPEHHFFWTKYYAEAVEIALDSGATCVGVDMVLTFADPQGESPLLRTAIKHRGKVILGTYLEPTTGVLVTPFRKLVAAAGAENLALLNLWRDFDGVVRSQPVFPIHLKALGRDAFPLFAARLAEIQSGADLETSTGTFLGRKIPLEDSRLLINFASARPPEISLQKLLELHRQGEDERLRELLGGRVVLIGSVLPSDNDAVETPLSLERIASPELARTLNLTEAERRSSTPGLLVHALIVETLLRGVELRATSSVVTIALIFLFVSTTAVLVRFLKPTYAVGLAVCFGAGYWFLGFAVVSQRLLLLPVVPILLAVPLTLGLLYAYRYGHVERQRARLRATFGRYVAQEVVEEMLKFPDDYDPSNVTEREVTVMFSDINGFSTVCEGRSAAEITQLLNQHFREMSDIIFRNQGTLIRFNGDEFMVLFGAPKQLEWPERAAVKTALEMVARLAELESQDRGQGGFYNVKIGIHSGKMILT
ncbi:MAG: adenylate/guanylate cyclase domain-containing protein, partial [Candidatus Eremiobacteraeota bacterium]|nr:adenylate/guanylate cyclase domain-containing protein [Candidatus Eremiobacteraeota bacterium]